MTFDASDNEVAGLTWDKIKQRLAGSAAAILPIGAGAKQHGLHMPMATDQVFAAYFARARREGRRADLADADLRRLSGLRRLCRQRQPLNRDLRSCSDRDCRRSNQVWRQMGPDPRHRPQHHRAGRCGDQCYARTIAGAPSESLRASFVATVHALKQQPYGSHADEMETSLMLAIAPELVDMTRAEACPVSPNCPSPGALSPDDPASPITRRAAASAIPPSLRRKRESGCVPPSSTICSTRRSNRAA
jgi:creatinine amidohydrolase